MTSTLAATASTASWLQTSPPYASHLAAMLALAATVLAIFPLTHLGEREIHGCMKMWPCLGDGAPVFR